MRKATVTEAKVDWCDQSMPLIGRNIVITPHYVECEYVVLDSHRHTHEKSSLITRGMHNDRSQNILVLLIVVGLYWKSTSAKHKDSRYRYQFTIINDSILLLEP